MNKHLYGVHQVEHLYITDNDSYKNLPRSDYVPGFGTRSSRRPQSLTSAGSKILAASARGRFDDLEVDDEDDDTPAFDFKGPHLSWFYIGDV